MKPLRVLIISHMFPSKALPRHGIFICREAQYLDACDVESHFLVARPYVPWPLYYLSKWSTYSELNSLLPPNGIKATSSRYMRLPGMWYRVFEGVAMSFALKRTARKLHESSPFDLVLGIPMLPDAQVAVKIGRDLGLPVASVAIGSDVMVYPEELPILRKLLKQMLQATDLVVGVSEAICRRLLEIYDRIPQPLCVYLGRDSSLFCPKQSRKATRKKLGFSSRDVIGIFVGKIAEKKGIKELVEATKYLTDKHVNFRLICVGDGPAMKLLIGLRNQVGRASLLLTGNIPPLKVPSYLQAADFMVFPSHSEGMPQAVLESMNCGLPVVATNVGGTSEAVVDGRNGLLIEPRNIEQLQRAMQQMIIDHEFRSMAGKESHRLATTKFDSHSNARSLANAMRSVVNRQKRNAGVLM